MIILLTGGSGCGKSTYGEKIAVSLEKPLYYVATMRPYDDECVNKIARHRRLRATKGFETIEKHTDIHEIKLPQKGGTALLECMCNLTANEMFDENGNILPVEDKIMEGIDSLSAQLDNLIIVTNDVGSDCQEYDEGTLQYIVNLGRLNERIAKKADRVTEVVCGIPLPVKGELVKLEEQK